MRTHRWYQCSFYFQCCWCADEKLNNSSIFYVPFHSYGGWLAWTSEPLLKHRDGGMGSVEANWSFAINKWIKARNKCETREHQFRTIKLLLFSRSGGETFTGVFNYVSSRLYIKRYEPKWKCYKLVLVNKKRTRVGKLGKVKIYSFNIDLYVHMNY